MNAVHRRRLLNVAKALRESPAPKAFTMCRFGNTGADGPNFPCGTPACALGHYAARRDLQRTFELIIKPPSVTGGWDYEEYVRSREDPEGDGVSYRDGDSVCRHFGLTEDQADELFGGFGCGDAQTPKVAARYIERFVARASV